MKYCVLHSKYSVVNGSTTHLINCIIYCKTYLIINNAFISAKLIFYFNLEYRDAFALFDKRGDGKIDSDQIGDVLRALNLNPSQAEVLKIVQEIDPKGRI